MAFVSHCSSVISHSLRRIPSLGTQLSTVSRKGPRLASARAARPFTVSCTTAASQSMGTTNADILRLDETERFSQAVVHNGIVTTAGLLAPTDTGPSVTKQTEAILAQAEQLISQAGSDKSRILSVNIWLTNVDDVGEFNAVWDKWLDRENKPVRACVQSALVRADALVEIQVFAAVAAKQQRVVSTSEAAAAVGPYNQGIVVENGTAYISGCIALTADTGVLLGDNVSDQTEQALRNLRAILKECGCGVGDVVKTTILLADIGDFATVNGIYEAFFEGGRVPARSCFAAKQLPKGALVEIEAIAVVPSVPAETS